MLLSELNKKDKATIIKINGTKSLRERLLCFGIVENSQVWIQEYSLNKNTIEISVDRLLVGLRLKEAEQIEVKQEQ